MGTPGAARREPAHPVMAGQAIPPFRMVQLVKMASKMADLMFSGVWHLSYEEIEIVLEILRTAVDGSRNAEGSELDMAVENDKKGSAPV